MTSPTPTEPAEDLRGLVDMALVEHIGGQIPGIKWSTDRALDAIMALFSSRLEAAEKELDAQWREHGAELSEALGDAVGADYLRAEAEARAQALQGQLDKAVEAMREIIGANLSSQAKSIARAFLASIPQEEEKT